jgi:tagaturonate reductase
MRNQDQRETILQFGAGRFLRAFVDRFVQNANDEGQHVGRVVIVQSTPGQRADLLKSQPAGFHVLVRGYADGELVDRVEPVGSISRALVAQNEWPAVLEVARSVDLKFIVTNATEAGYAVDPTDTVHSLPPHSMPAKLTQVLWTRFQNGGAPLVILPCELIEGNADKLRAIVCSLASQWGLPANFTDWVEQHCFWLKNLVDCIVTPGPTDHALSSQDQLLVSAEPYHLWAIQRPIGREVRLFSHPAIQFVDDLTPYYLRKVRILNGLHTAMAAKFRPLGFETVLQVLNDRTAARWLKDLLYEEVVPVLVHRAEGVALFAEQTLDRFRNPFLAHKLADIMLNHAAKVQVRLQPTFEEYQRLFGKPPRKLSEVLEG